MLCSATTSSEALIAGGTPGFTCNGRAQTGPGERKISAAHLGNAAQSGRHVSTGQRDDKGQQRAELVARDEVEAGEEEADILVCVRIGGAANGEQGCGHCLVGVAQRLERLQGEHLGTARRRLDRLQQSLRLNTQRSGQASLKRSG